jgi:hypothetical protein
LHGVGNMSKRKVRLVIYCEDKLQECFARRFLYGMRWTKNDIRVTPYPIGRGSAEQWVREAYIKELALFHRKLRTYAMIVITDGDDLGVVKRINQLEQACITADVRPRSKDDAVAIVVPTWSIETWIKYLEGSDYNEQQKTVKKKKDECKCYPAVDKLLALCKKKCLPQDAPSSLHAACVEFTTRIHNKM